MLAVDRAYFSPRNPYEDSPQSIGSGKRPKTHVPNRFRFLTVCLSQGATISAPHMHAYALEALTDHIKEGAKVLDVGSGTGYLTACFAIMVRPSSIRPLI